VDGEDGRGGSPTVSVGLDRPHRRPANRLDDIVVLVYKVDMAPAPPVYLGEFEQIVLPRESCGWAPTPMAWRSARVGGPGRARRVAHALYNTLDRMEHKQLVRWKIAVGGEERGRLPRRVYTLSARGLASIRAAQKVFRKMTVGLDDLLEEKGRTRCPASTRPVFPRWLLERVLPPRYPRGEHPR
jgi:hypothetical protein